MKPVLEWTTDRHGMARAVVGKLHLIAWCSAPGFGCWEIVTADSRGVLAKETSGLDDADAAKRAAEAAAVELLTEALAAFGVPVSCEGEFTAHPGIGIVDGDDGEMSAAYIAAMQRTLVRFLWRSIEDQAACCCEPGDPGPDCAAWRALGFRGHFQWRRAGKALAGWVP